MRVVGWVERQRNPSTAAPTVARMERSVIRDWPFPDYAALHPGYNTQAARSRLAIEASRANASR